jgi:uncharacterized protein
MTTLTANDLAEQRAAAMLDQEKIFKQQNTQHEAEWGEGPPHYNAGSFEFWHALHEGQFKIGRCGACNHVYYPPRIICPECWAKDVVQLQDTPALGVVASYTEVHVMAHALRSIAPLRIAAIDLDEGVRVLTWLMGEGATEAHVGQRVKIVVEEVLEKTRFIAHPVLQK